jgi:nitroimidazol reductase NimA-like FMN-containing flavoprotein (pyridoxamine 5'-phosphate oxidase superfamily)
MTAPGPVFAELTKDECVALLTRNNVGRIAFSYRDHVDIEPIHFVYADEWLFGRTSFGSKLRTLAHNRWVAFEADEVRSPYDWTSVVVKGGLYMLEPTGVYADAYTTAVAALRSLVPEVFTEDDPAPNRTIVFRIHADQVTGRSARPAR